MVAATHRFPSDEEQHDAEKFVDNLLDPCAALDDPDSEMLDSDPFHEAGARLVESRFGHIRRRRKRITIAVVAIACAVIVALSSYVHHLKNTPAGIASRPKPPLPAMEAAVEHIKAKRYVNAIDAIKHLDDAETTAAIGFCKMQMAQETGQHRIKFLLANEAIAAYESAIDKGYPREHLIDNIGLCRRISCRYRTRDYKKAPESFRDLDQTTAVDTLFTEMNELANSPHKSVPSWDRLLFAVQKWPDDLRLQWVCAQCFAISAYRSKNDEHVTLCLEHLWSCMDKSGRASRSKGSVAVWNPALKSHPEFIAFANRTGSLFAWNPLAERVMRIAAADAR